MHGPEESDSVIVAMKPTNKAEQSVAEPVEPRTETKGNADQQSTRRAQDRASVSQALERVRQAARQRKKERFTTLLHHVDPAMLRTAFYAMKRDAAPGVDGMTWETYEQDLDRRIETLHARVQAGTYRALPSRRSYIPKEDGSKRPLAVAALEDKIVQRAVAAVLSAIHEEDFDRRRRTSECRCPPARRYRRTRPRCGVSLIQKGADRLINHRFTHFRDLLPSTASLAHQIATRRRRLSQIRPSPPMAPAVTRIHSGLIRVPRMRPAAAPVIAAACHPLSAARANT
jgi:hypothetical protein